MIRQTHFYVCFLMFALGIGVTDQQSHRSHQLSPQIYQSSNTAEYANLNTHDRNKQYIYLEDQIAQQASAIEDIVVEISLFSSNYIGSFSSPYNISSMYSGDSIYSYSDTNIMTYSPTSIPSRRPRVTPQPVINSIPSPNLTIAPSKHHNAPNATGHTVPPSSFTSSAPTDQPTSLPCAIASVLHSGSPSHCVTMLSSVPSRTPSPPPTNAPTRRPSQKPTLTPSITPSTEPTSSPTPSPLSFPTENPSYAPTAPPPSAAPTNRPSTSPTPLPTNAPSIVPSASPTAEPSAPPTGAPTAAPTCIPTSAAPTAEPSAPPTGAPTAAPTCIPTSAAPTAEPSAPPTGAPTAAPSCIPTTAAPTAEPSAPPTGAPTAAPSCIPTTAAPTAEPSAPPTGVPTTAPSCIPTTAAPAAEPSAPPTRAPTSAPSRTPTYSPSAVPTAKPSVPFTGAPAIAPSCTPTYSPSAAPTAEPPPVPTNTTSQSPNSAPVLMPSAVPSMQPSATSNSSAPTESPITEPSAAPSRLPSLSPSHIPSIAPTNISSPIPSAVPSPIPSAVLSSIPSAVPSAIPSAVPSVTPPVPVVFVFLAVNTSLPDSAEGQLQGNESRAIQAAAIREVRNSTGSRAESIIADVTIAVLEEAEARRMNSPLRPHYTQREVVWEVSIALADRNVSAEVSAAAVEGLHSALVSGALQRAIREIGRTSPEVPSLWYLVACEADEPDSAAQCLQQLYPPPAVDNTAPVCAQGTPEWDRLYDYPAPLPWYWLWTLLLLSVWAALIAVCAYWIVQSALSPERRQTGAVWLSVLLLACSAIQLAYFAVVLKSYYDSTFGEGKLACLEFVFLSTSSTVSSSDTGEGLLVMLRALTYAFTLSAGSTWLWAVYSSAMPLLPRSQSVGVRGRSFRMAQSACLVLTGTGGVCAVFVLVSWGMGMEVGHLNQRALIVEGLAGAGLLLHGCVLALLMHCELHTSSSRQNVLRLVTLPIVLCVLYGSLVLVCIVRSVLRSPAAALAVYSISSRLLGLALVIAAAAASAREGASIMTNREVGDETDAAELEWGRDASTLAPGEASLVADSDTQSEINRAAQRATAPPLLPSVQDSQKQQQRSRRHNASEYVLYFEDRAFTIRMRSREEEKQDESPVLGEESI